MVPVMDTDPGILDLSTRTPVGGTITETLTLSEPQTRLRLRLPAGKPGRAEAVFPAKSWAAKHYWQESPGVVVYEFDEPLPAGPVSLKIPLQAT
jgi:hypothetical protein